MDTETFWIWKGLGEFDAKWMPFNWKYFSIKYIQNSEENDPHLVMEITKESTNFHIIVFIDNLVLIIPHFHILCLYGIELSYPKFILKLGQLVNVTKFWKSEARRDHTTTDFPSHYLPQNTSKTHLQSVVTCAGCTDFGKVIK